MRPGKPPGQVDQLAANLRRRQPEEIRRRRRLYLGERPVKPQRCALHDVVGPLPAVDAGVFAKHHPRQAGQLIERQRHQLIPRARLALRVPVEQALNPQDLAVAAHLRRLTAPSRAA